MANICIFIVSLIQSQLDINLWWFYGISGKFVTPSSVHIVRLFLNQ